MNQVIIVGGGLSGLTALQRHVCDALVSNDKVSNDMSVMPWYRMTRYQIVKQRQGIE